MAKRPALTKGDIAPWIKLHIPVAASRDLTPAMKLVHAALCDYLPPQDAVNRWVCVPPSAIGRKIGLSARYVRRCLAELTRLGYLRARASRGPGGVSAFHVLAPPTPANSGPIGPPPPGPIVPGAGPIVPGAGPIVPGAGPIGPATPDAEDHPTNYQTISSELSPEGLPEAADTPPVAAGTKSEKAEESERRALEVAKAAYLSARGTGLPAAWERAVLADCRSGAADIWLEVTGAEIQTAYEALPAKRQPDFAPWHVANAVGPGRRQKREADRMKREAEATRAADEKAAAAQQAAEAAAWERCSPEERAELTTQALRQCRRIRGEQRDAVIQTTAKFLAWEAERKDESHD